MLYWNKKNEKPTIRMYSNLQALKKCGTYRRRHKGKKKSIVNSLSFHSKILLQFKTCDISQKGRLIKKS